MFRIRRPDPRVQASGPTGLRKPFFHADSVIFKIAVDKSVERNARPLAKATEFTRQVSGRPLPQVFSRTTRYADISALQAGFVRKIRIIGRYASGGRRRSPRRGARVQAPLCLRAVAGAAPDRAGLGGLGGLPDDFDQVGADLAAHQMGIDVGIAFFPELDTDVLDGRQLQRKLEGAFDDAGGLNHHWAGTPVPYSLASAIRAA